MSYVSEVKKVAEQILEKLNELDSQKEVVIMSENSTGRIERIICPTCNEDVGINDTVCSCGQRLVRC